MKSLKSGRPEIRTGVLPFSLNFRLAGFSNHLDHLLLNGAVEEALELASADRVLELADGLSFDLPDSLSRDFEDTSHLLERVGITVSDAVTQLDNLAFAVGEGLEHLLDSAAEHLLGGGVGGAAGTAPARKIEISAISSK